MTSKLCDTEAEWWHCVCFLSLLTFCLISCSNFLILSRFSRNVEISSSYANLSASNFDLAWKTMLQWHNVLTDSSWYSLHQICWWNPPYIYCHRVTSWLMNHHEQSNSRNISGYSRTEPDTADCTTSFRDPLFLSPLCWLHHFTFTWLMTETAGLTVDLEWASI